MCCEYGPRPIVNQMAYSQSTLGLPMDKLKLRGLNLGRVFNYRCGHASTLISTCTSSKQPNLKLKTWPKTILCSLLIAFALLGLPVAAFQKDFNCFENYPNDQYVNIRPGNPY
jgi:hypothetical protein